MKHAPPWHTTSIENHGRRCYSEKGLRLPPRKRGSLFTLGSPLQAALHLSRSLAHAGRTPLTLRSFSRTSFQLLGGLPTLPPPSTSGSVLHLSIHEPTLLSTCPYHLRRLSRIKSSMLLKPKRLLSSEEGTLSLNETPQIHLIMALSALSRRIVSSSFTAQVSHPWRMTVRTHAPNRLPFLHSENLLEVSTGKSSLNLPQPHLILVTTLSPAPPPALIVSPR